MINIGMVGKYQNIIPNLNLFYNYLTIKQKKFRLVNKEGFLCYNNCGKTNLLIFYPQRENALLFTLKDYVNLIIPKQLTRPVNTLGQLSGIDSDLKIDFFDILGYEALGTYDIDEQTSFNSNLLQKVGKDFFIVSSGKYPDRKTKASIWPTTFTVQCGTPNVYNYLGKPSQDTKELLIQIEVVDPEPEWLYLFKDFVANDLSSLKIECKEQFNLYNPNCSKCFNSVTDNQCKKQFDNTCRPGSYSEGILKNPACVAFCSQPNLGVNDLNMCQSAFLNACKSGSLLETYGANPVCQNVFNPKYTKIDQSESQNLANAFWNSKCANLETEPLCDCINPKRVEQGFKNDITNYFQARYDYIEGQINKLIEQSSDEQEKESYRRKLQQIEIELNNEAQTVIDAQLKSADKVCFIQKCFNPRDEATPRTNQSKCNKDSIEIKICQNDVNIIGKDSDIDAKIFQSCFDQQPSKVNWVLIIGIILVIVALISLGIIVFV